MWDIPTYECREDTSNTVSVGFHSHKLASNLDTWQDRHLQHKYQDLHLTRANMFAHHNHLVGKVVIGIGCMPKVKLQFASAKREHMDDEGLSLMSILPIAAAGFFRCYDADRRIASGRIFIGSMIFSAWIIFIRFSRSVSREGVMCILFLFCILYSLLYHVWF